MFRYESEMIPVLVKNLSEKFKTKYITTEFGTGNGVADLVFTTKMSDENLFFNDYSSMALFVKLFDLNRLTQVDLLEQTTFDKVRLKKLIKYLEEEEYIHFSEGQIIKSRKYQAHTKNLFSIEAKLKDWKSGFYQALRYKFFSNKSYLAYPKQFIHRVDLELLTSHNIGLIAVDIDSIEFILEPKKEIPKDKTSHLFLAEMFAQKFKKR